MESILFLTLIVAAIALPLENHVEDVYEDKYLDEPLSKENRYLYADSELENPRERRSTQGGGHSYPNSPNAPHKSTTLLIPEFQRRGGSNNAGFNVHHQAKDYSVSGHFDKTFSSGSKPTWNIQYERKFKRSIQPEETEFQNVQPEFDGQYNVEIGHERVRRCCEDDTPSFPDLPELPQKTETTLLPTFNRQDGSNNAGVDLVHRTPDYDLSAHWDKTFSGPGKSQPSWNVQYEGRFRSAAQPEEIEVQYFEEEPQRLKRSLQAGGPTLPGQDSTKPVYGTSVSPTLNRQDGNTNAGLVIDHKTKSHDINGHWDKVVRGPARAKPNWGVKGTWRFRRDVGTSVNPSITRQDGTTNAGIDVAHKTKQTEINGHWDKNIRGPAKAKPNWKVRGSYKW